MGNIPALQYTVHHSLDRLRRQHNYYENEILATRKFMFGNADADPNISASYGIVSASNPTTHLAGDTSPLAVSVNLNNQLTVDVRPGFAIFRSGVYLELHNTVQQVTLADTSVNTPNVVYLYYVLDAAPPVPNRFQQSVIPYTVRIGDPLDNLGTVNNESVLIRVVSVDTYNQFAASVLADAVPLAVVTMQAVTVGGVVVNQLSVDHTRASYSFNRPWFSSVDLEHRLQVGTGAITDTNPHATSANDLTVGDLSMFQLHTDHGMVVAKDRSIAKVPGYRCTSVITDTMLVDDVAGTLTGYSQASYIELPYFPVRVGRVWIVSTNTTLPGLHVPHTNRIAFPGLGPAGEPLSVYYTRAEVAEPPLPNSTTFRTNGPNTQELAIAGGLGLVSLTATEETFADAYQFPMRYEMFMDAAGALLKTPQVVYCYRRFIDLGTSDTFDITPYGPAKLLVGLLGATNGPTLDVQLRIYGTDTNGTTINELFTFNTANWAPVGTVPVLPVPTTTAVHFSTSTFATLDNITVEALTGEGANAGVMVWMAQTPYSNYDNQADALHIATVDWDGLRLARVYDKRVIGATLRDDLNEAVNAELQRLNYILLGGGNQTVYVEDFRRPRYHSLETPAELNENAANYPTYQFTKQQVGLHGYYRSIAFPVAAGSGMTWRVALFAAENLVDPWFPNRPTILTYETGAWQVHTMTAVPGVPGTWEATTAVVPTRVQVQLYPGQCAGMAVYG